MAKTSRKRRISRLRICSFLAANSKSKASFRSISRFLLLMVLGRIVAQGEECNCSDEGQREYHNDRHRGFRIMKFGSVVPEADGFEENDEMQQHQQRDGR